MAIQQRTGLRMYILSAGFIVSSYAQYVQMTLKKGYINVLPSVINICFSLNRPNYARWGSLFFNKLSSMDSQALEILKAGAFNIRRTKKSCARSDIDLTLDQTVNRDVVSQATGISAFRNSDKAFSGGRSL